MPSFFLCNIDRRHSVPGVAQTPPSDTGEGGAVKNMTCKCIPHITGSARSLRGVAHHKSSRPGSHAHFRSACTHCGHCALRVCPSSSKALSSDAIFSHEGASQCRGSAHRSAKPPSKTLHKAQQLTKRLRRDAGDRCISGAKYVRSVWIRALPMDVLSRETLGNAPALLRAC